MTVREARVWKRYYEGKEREQLELPGPTEAYLMQLTSYLEVLVRGFVSQGNRLPIDSFKLKREKPEPDKSLEPSNLPPKESAAAASKARWAARLGFVPEEKPCAT